MSSVDVIVPCYNYGRYLRDCVTSVLNQEGVRVRVLVIDDCSTDETAKVGAVLAAEDSRVQVRVHARNHGHIATYNEGIDWAAADYMLVLSADDALTPRALARAVDIMDHHDVGFVFGRRVLLLDDARPCDHRFVDRPWSAKIMTGAEFCEKMCSSYNLVCTPTAVVRTAVQKAVGYYSPQLPHTGDLEMWLRFAARGGVAMLDSDQAYWRRHSSNMREGYQGPQDFIHHKMAYDAVLTQSRDRIPGALSMQQAVHRKLADQACRRAHLCFSQGERDQCLQYLEVALNCDPDIWRTQVWFRLRLKRAMGLTAWRMVSRVRSLSGRVAGTNKGVSAGSSLGGAGDESQWLA